MTSILNSIKLTDKNLIEAVLNSYYIIDYGYISKVHADGTVDITHAKKLVMTDGTVLDGTITTKVQVLTLSLGALAIKVEYKKGDKVLMLGLKDMVEDVADVKQPEEPKGYLHYSRSTMKALPFCVFNEAAKITVEAAAGTLKINTEKKIELNGNSKQFVTWDALNTALQQLLTQIKAHTHPVSGAAAGSSVDLQPVTLDLSGAKTTTVVTGG